MSRLRALVETAVMVGLSTALGTLTLFHMPQGGSVTPGSMVPLLLVALRHGPKWGITGGVALGLINFLLKPEVVHPAQMIIDYPLAFGLLGLAGLAAGKNEFLAGPLSALALVGRFAAHVVSGVIFFSEYAGDQNVWLYSIIYNGSYMLPEMLISGALLLMLHPTLRRVLPGASTHRYSA